MENENAVTETSAQELADMALDVIESCPANEATIAAAKQLVLERLVTDSN